MAPVVAPAPDHGALGLEGQAREDGDPVVALLAVDQQVRIAERAHRLARERVVGDLGLLQADHVRGGLGGEAGQVVEALAQGVDVPGGEPEGHGAHLEREPRFRRDAAGGHGPRSTLRSSNPK